MQVSNYNRQPGTIENTLDLLGILVATPKSDAVMMAVARLIEKASMHGQCGSHLLQ